MLDEPGDASIEQKHESLTINGRQAESIGFVSHQGDTTRYAYIIAINVDGRPFMIGTDQLDEPSPRLRRIVTQMAYSLSFT
jgi:hypothetical protein